MKILKSILVVCMLFVCATSMAFQPSYRTEKLTVNYTLSTYIDALQNGKLKGLAQVIDDNAKFTSKRGEKFFSHSKEEMLKAMKNSENVKQNCEVIQSVIETLPNQTIVKVSMKYDTFSKVNYVTLSESESGWKIVHVSTSFE